MLLHFAFLNCNTFLGCLLLFISLKINFVNFRACIFKFICTSYLLIFFKDFLVDHKTDTWRGQMGTSWEVVLWLFDPAQRPAETVGVSEPQEP